MQLKSSCNNKSKFYQNTIYTMNEKDKKGKETYATDDPTDVSNTDLEKMAKEAIKKFKSL